MNPAPFSRNKYKKLLGKSEFFDFANLAVKSYDHLYAQGLLHKRFQPHLPKFPCLSKNFAAVLELSSYVKIIECIKQEVL